MKRRAANGEGEAQFSHGCMLVCEADGGGGLRARGEGGRSPKAEVGLHLHRIVSCSLTKLRRVDG